MTNQPLSELLRVWQQLLERVHGAVLPDELRAGPGDLHRLHCQDIHLQAGIWKFCDRAMANQGTSRTVYEILRTRWAVLHISWHAVRRVAMLPEADEVPHFFAHAAIGHVEQFHGDGVAPTVAQLHMEHVDGLHCGFVVTHHVVLERQMVLFHNKLLQRRSEKSFGLAMKESIGQTQAISRDAKLAIQLHNGITHHVQQRCHCRSLPLRLSFLDIWPHARNQAHLKGKQDYDQTQSYQELVREELVLLGRTDFPETACTA
mmetsp:Transcript_39971/g.101525  ORF Transcript_39971/g.101525 Transcript_39971/m.101525 type:complete len:260 (-) Transcript_39971:281-1060(-)